MNENENVCSFLRAADPNEMSEVFTRKQGHKKWTQSFTERCF